MKTIRAVAPFALLAAITPAAHAQLRTAGTLYVDLRSTNSTAGGSVWLNEANGFGAGMNFTNAGAFSVDTNVIGSSIPGVLFGGTSAYLGPRTTPDLDGASDRSIEVWVLNPAVADEETLVSWGHRGGNPDGSNLSFNFGANLGFGAVGHWGSYDIGWVTAGNIPTANQWHHFVYTCDGNTNVQVYVDGVLRAARAQVTPLRTWANEAIMIGAQRGATNGAPDTLRLSGYINSVRVHGGRLAPEDVVANYQYGPNIPPTGVRLLSQPQNVTTREGGPANFAITKLGSEPVFYQWLRNGSPIAGATNFSYSIASAPVGDNGAGYSVVASNFFNNTSFTATSTVAQLTVLPSPPISQSLVHRYSFNGNANDTVGGANGTLQGAATISGGQVQLNGTAGTYVNLPPRLLDGLGAVTMEFWASFGVNGNFARVFDFGNTNGTAGIRYMFWTHRAGSSNVLRQAIFDPLVEKATSANVPTTFDNRTNVHVACVFDPLTGFMGFYTNGVLASSIANLTSLTNVDNAFSFLGRSVFAADPLLNGSIDEFRIYSQPLSAAQIATNFLNGPDATITGGPPTFVVNAPDQVVPESLPATMFATVSGGAPIRLQWFRNGTAISGATNSAFTIPSANLNDNGAQFFVVATGTSSVTSRVATLTVINAAASLKNRWKFDTDARDSVGTAHGVLTNSVVGAPPARLTNGAVVMNGGGQYVDLPNNLVTNYNSMTVETWVTDNISGTWGRIYDFGNSTAGEGAAGSGTQYMFLTAPANTGGLRFALTVGTGEQLGELVPSPLTNGIRRHIVLTMDNVARTARMYVDGAQVAANVTFTITPAGMGPTVNNWVGRSQFSADAFFSGSMDELRIYDSALAPGTIQRTFAFGPDFPLADGPAQVVRQPVGATVQERSSVTLTAPATGRYPIAVQWFRNGVIVPNATNFALAFNASVADDNAVYQLWATNNVNGTNFAVASSNAVLRVIVDTVAPTVARVQNIGTNAVEITFSESVVGATATNLANYSIAGVAINTGSLSSDGRVVILNTSPLALGGNYTLTISNVTDTAATPNLLSPNPTARSFVAQAYAITDIGSSGVGAVTTVSGGVNLVGGGQGTGVGAARTNDQITFAYQNITGDFDMQVRLNSLKLGGTGSDLWARAGLMARDGSSDTARFAATFATPGLAGAFFQARTNASGAAQSSGTFPVDYPNTWVRLRRVGNIFDGFASLDGQNWGFLGSATMAVPATLQVGLAASADSSGGAALTAQIRDIGPGGISILTTNLALPFEPLAASSRKTGLVISEIMYNPPDAWGGSNNLEWIELFNTGVAPEDLTGHRLTGDISFTFPPGTTLQPGQFLLLARDPAAFRSFYGGLAALGPWTGNLPNNGGTLRLVNELGGRLLEIEYDNENGWPVGADGTGHSLVLRKPSYGENDPRAWGHSAFRRGSPGKADPAPPALAVVINEFSQATNAFIELKNMTTFPLDVGNYILTDDPATNRYVFQAFSIIPPNGYLSVSRAALGFSPDATDGHLYLMLPDGSVLDAVEFGSYTGLSRGRLPNGSPYWSEMRTATPGAANVAAVQRDVIINEIMYHPISELNNDEYIELYNRGTGTVSLAGWRIRGGVDFTFPNNASIPARGFVVVAENLTNLMARYTNLTTANTFGNYDGALANGGERIALQIPVQIVTNGPSGPVTNNTHSTVVEVNYRDGGRWGQYSDGGGSSLELIDPRADGRFAANWADSDESAKAPWTTIDVTAPLLNGQTDQNGNIIANGAPTRLEIFLQDNGEVLVDDVEMRNNGGANLVTNPSFDSGLTGFNLNGTHRRSFVQNSGGFTGSNVLHVVSTGRGDAGPNKVWFGFNQLTVNNPLQTGTATATNTGTIRAQVRWLKGSPYIMFRTRGHWMEATLRLNLPTRLGTPGAPNSRLVANAGPSISEVAHSPVLPAPGQPVVVSARILDADGPGTITLSYRLDPSLVYTNVTMRDDGTGGDTLANDAIYSATIPGFAANALVAFFITAGDDAAVNSTFPTGVPLRECLVRFGETQIAGSLGTYRLWVTASNVTAWTTAGTGVGQRERNANDPIDCTFVYGNNRVVYNAGTLYSGSPWHTANAPYAGPAAPLPPDYEVNFPADDKLLGAENFVLSSFDVTQPVGTFFADRAVQNEATANWIGRKLGQQYNHRRNVHVVFNGARRGTIYEDQQQPSGEMLDEYYPNDSHGELRKIEDWFEFDNAGSAFTVNTRNDIGSQSASLLRVNDNSGAVDSKRYRWTFRPRASDNPNDWYNLTNMIVAVNTPGTGADFVSNTLAWIDIRNFMRPIATHHICGDWDSFGYERGKNMFAYKPDNEPWKLLIWDIELGLGHGLSRSPVDGIYRVPHDAIIAKMWTTPRFQREYLGALLEACNGPLAPGTADVLLNARYDQFLKNGLPVISPDYIKNFIAARREIILSQIPSSSFSVDGTNSITTTNPVFSISGLAPVNVSDVVIEGRSVAQTWNTLTNWIGNYRLAPGTNRLVVRALDGNGTEVTNVTITAVLNGGAPWPALRINEWMADNAGFIRDPADGDADDWFELYNPTGSAVALTGWSLTDDLANKTQFVIPSGYSVPAGGFSLVWADGETGQNAPGANLHVNFQLSRSGDSIALFAPDGQLIDSVTFGAQAENVSQGRSPDGSATIITLGTPTPAAANVAAAGPRINIALSAGVVSLSFNTVVGRTYRVEYKDDLLNATWTALAADRPGTGSPITVTDNIAGRLRRFYRVSVN